MPDRSSVAYAPSVTRSRPAPTAGWARLARAGVVGGSSLTLASAAHVAGGGALPGAGLLVIAGVAVALVAVSLTGRRLRFAVLLTVLCVEQVLLHLLFHAATTTARCVAVSMPGHAMPDVCGAGSGATAYGGSMLLGHLLAVVATAWLLARGEGWLWRTVDRVHRWAGLALRRLRRPRPSRVPLDQPAPTAVRLLSCGPRAPPVVLI